MSSKDRHGGPDRQDVVAVAAISLSLAGMSSCGVVLTASSSMTSAPLDPDQRHDRHPSAGAQTGAPWVVTFPIPIRLSLSRRPHLLTAALQACLRVLFSWHRRRIRRRGLRPPSCGAVTFVQRFGSALQLSVHFHVVATDGAFDHDDVFVADEALDEHDVREILVRADRKVIALLHRFLSRQPRHRDPSGSPRTRARSARMRRSVDAIDTNFA